MYTKSQDRPHLFQGVHMLREQLLLMATVFFCCLWVLFQIDLQSSSHLLVIQTPDDRENISQAFIVNTKGCRIQYLDPFDESIADCIYEEEPVICDKENLGTLVKTNGNLLYIDTSVVSNYNLTEEKVTCCYMPFWRREISFKTLKKNPRKADTTIRYANYCTPFTSITVEDQFIRVFCSTMESKDFYQDFFSFVKINEKEENIEKTDPNKISVLIIGVDSVSRLNLHRQMPKTMKFLNDFIKPVEMLGFNKVGDNTFPNLVPILTGISEKELISTCWKNSNTVFDKCPFIWKHYKSEGYITGFAEDAARIGVFNYLKVGFRKQPTDFYFQPFNLAAEDEIGHEKWLNAVLCLGKRLNLDVLLDSAKQFAINFKKRKTFGFFWGTSLTHDFLNLPKFGDEYYLNFFKSIYDNGIFNSSIVIFLSDHGIRWGAIRQTYQGYLEERLPFLIISYPEWFANNFPIAVENLRGNRRKLTTPYDIHTTLKDLTNLTKLRNKVLKTRSTDENLNRGISLFTVINETRTCKDAGISDIWCTCHQSVSVSVTDRNVENAAASMVNHLNGLLKGYMQCSELKLNRIINARVEEVPLHKSEKLARNSSLTDYTITIETIPGEANFEGTVRFSNMNKLYQVMPPVSRTNTYGSQSFCISHYSLKLYCYCKSYWEKKYLNILNNLGKTKN